MGAGHQILHMAHSIYPEAFPKICHPPSYSDFHFSCQEYYPKKKNEKEKHFLPHLNLSEVVNFKGKTGFGSARAQVRPFTFLLSKRNYTTVCLWYRSKVSALFLLTWGDALWDQSAMEQGTDSKIYTLWKVWVRSMPSWPITYVDNLSCSYLNKI